MAENRTKRFLYYQKPGICWAFVILILSSITPPSLEIPRFWDLFAPDKWVHLFMYGVMTILLYRGYFLMNDELAEKKMAGRSLVFSVCYGGMIELYQGVFLPMRTADWTDFVANTIGSFIGLSIARRLYASP